MPRRVDVKLELPDEVATYLRDDELATKAKEAFVMELLREHHLSQGNAADLLGIDHHELFDLMTKYRLPVIDLTPEEHTEALEKPFPRQFSRP